MIDLLLFAGIEPTGTIFQTINNLLLQHQFKGESVNVSEELRIGGCFYDQSNLYSICKIPAASQWVVASIYCILVRTLILSNLNTISEF